MTPGRYGRNADDELERQDDALRAGHDWQYDDPIDGHVIGTPAPADDDDPGELDRFGVMRADDRRDDRERRR